MRWTYSSRTLSKNAHAPRHQRSASKDKYYRAHERAFPTIKTKLDCLKYHNWLRFLLMEDGEYSVTADLDLLGHW
jgi:hypothetical protein